MYGRPYASDVANSSNLVCRRCFASGRGLVFAYRKLVPSGLRRLACCGNMAGLFVLMATGLFDPQRGLLRAGITVVALGLILPSAYFVVAKAAG